MGLPVALDTCSIQGDVHGQCSFPKQPAIRVRVRVRVRQWDIHAQYSASKQPAPTTVSNFKSPLTKPSSPHYRKDNRQHSHKNSTHTTTR